MVFVLAYSGIVGTMLLDGGIFTFVLLTAVGWDFLLSFFELEFLSPDSGLVFSMTIEGVSFRTGLRG